MHVAKHSSSLKVSKNTTQRRASVSQRGVQSAEQRKRHSIKNKKDITKMQLFNHQKEGIEFLKKNKKAILADEMGLGKTRQAIIASGDYMREEEAEGLRKALVICPASLKINWEREIKMVYPNDDVYVVQSGPEEELPYADWFVINYDMLAKYEGQIMEKVSRKEIEIAIVDEAHYIKGKKTIRAVKTLEIVDKLEVVYMLTGTPIMNRPIELFNLLRAVRHPLGKNRSFYSKRYCGGHLKTIVKKSGGIIRFWDEGGATRLPELRGMTENIILRRTKKEVLDLPPKIVSVQICELDKEWQRKYDNAWDEYLEWVANHPSEGKDIGNIMDAKHLVELMKLKQICSQAKLERMVSDIRSAVEQGEKVIVFSQFTNTINTISEMLGQEKRASAYGDKQEAIKCVTLTGQHNQDERQHAVDSFQKDDETKVFIANIIAGGVGITLTQASIVMFADMEWSPEIHSQAEDRAHRIGQEGTVNVYYYVLADTIEEDIVDILERKKSLIRAVMDGTQDAIYESSMASEFLDRLKERMLAKRQ